MMISWISRIEGALARRPLTTDTSRRPLMETIRLCAESVIARHKSGCTEAMYQRLLQAELYHRDIPCLAEVDTFTVSGAVPVHVGRLDLEVDHRIILELKVAPRITPKHIRQLQKYARARTATGMHVEAAAVVCWTDHDTVEMYHLPLKTSPYFRLSAS